MTKVFEIGKDYTPRDKYCFAFEDGFLACLKLCLEFATEKRKIQLLETAEEQLRFFYKFLNSLRDILYKNNLVTLSDEEIESINKDYKEVLWQDYKLHEEKYTKILQKELENATVLIEDNDESMAEDDLKEKESQADIPCCDTSCCDKDMCVEPGWKEKYINLQHELYKAKRTIEGLEYALYNCIPYHNREPKRD